LQFSDELSRFTEDLKGWPHGLRAKAAEESSAFLKKSAQKTFDLFALCWRNQGWPRCVRAGGFFRLWRRRLAYGSPAA
jgi:hypothetical protein